MAIEKSNSPADRELKGIGGWLILPAIGLVIGGLGLAGGVVSAVVGIFLATSETATETTAGPVPFLVALALVEVILFVANAYAAYLFFRQRAVAPRAMISLLILGLASAIGLMGLALALGLYILLLNIGGALAGSVIACLIWIPYFKRSERVKATFIVAGTEQEARWFNYGTNVGMSLVLAAVVVVAAIWLSGTLLGSKATLNWASGGPSGLSARTQALLEELPCDVRITNLYEEAPGDPNAADLRDMRRQVQDLLERYAKANPSRITVEKVDPTTDTVGGEALAARFRERYKAEIDQRQALIDESQGLINEAVALMDQEAKRLTKEADGWTGGPPDAIEGLRSVAQSWSLLENAGKGITGAIQDLKSQTIPDYTGSLEQVRGYLKTVDEGFAALPNFYARIMAEAKDTPPPASILTIMTSTRETYGPWRGKFDAFAKKTAALKPFELDTIVKDLNQHQTILLESPTRIKVIAYDSVWPINPAAAAPRGESISLLKQRLFAGERAVTSALMGLCKEEQPAILFVTFGNPSSEYGGPFAEMGSRLRQINFIVEDWDLARQRQMPRIEHASKIILVFTPPPPMNPRSPTPPPTAEVYQPAIDAVKAGAPALVLGEPGGFMGPTVPYGELFGFFGVKAILNAEAVHKVLVDSNTGEERAITRIDITQYNKHVITEPIGGLPSTFIAVCPLEIMKDPPAGVAAQPLVEMPGGPDFWADTNIISVMQAQAKRDDDDLAGPLPLAVASTRQTADAEQKAVLFGGHFAEDGITQYSEQGQSRFPGSVELFVNSAMWVAGETRLIQVSPEAMKARRLSVPDNTPIWIALTIIPGLPLLVLALGITVYIIRRR
jgi:hypothetical protein